MKYHFPLLTVTVVFCCCFSCKKDAQQQAKSQNNALENGLVTLSVNGQVVDAAIDTNHNTIIVTVPDVINEQKDTVNFTLAANTTATVDNKTVNSGVILNLAQPVTFTVASNDKKRSTSFKLFAQTKMNYFGLGGTLISQKSLNRDYEFYYDQVDDVSEFENTNCGPTAGTMAVKWADSTFKKTPADARASIHPEGADWYMADIVSWLNADGISSVTDSITNLNSLVKQSIDNNRILILLVDMNYIPQNQNGWQHTEKFYQTPGTWDHYLLIKGYKQYNDGLYLETYDPWSQSERYDSIGNFQLKGKDRYYSSDNVYLAAKYYSPYALIIAPKGQNAGSSVDGGKPVAALKLKQHLKFK